MIALLFSILASSAIFVIFKLFERYGIDTFQAIVYNYFTAFLCGIFLFGHEWADDVVKQSDWIHATLGCSLLFISLFILIGISSQRNGVGTTSVAVKMSMALSILAMILLYNEPVHFLKLLGIGLAFVGVILTSYTSSQKSNSGSSALWMLAVLFVGSSMLDLVLNYSLKHLLGALSPSLFSAFAFGIAGTIGSIILFLQVFHGKSKLQAKNVLAGILLGIPNFFSIYLLLMAYQTSGLTDSNVVTIVNIGIVGLSALLGWSLFKETMTTRKLLGLVLCLVAIALISING